MNQMRLGNFYFECGVLFDNVMLRASMLYATETLYNITETEMRQIERLEESYLRQALGTIRTCPLTEIYLSLGQYPARYEILKRRLLFLKFILNQSESTILYNFFQCQANSPTINDWVTTCKSDLKHINLQLSFQQIKEMNLNNFKSMLIENIKTKALSYLSLRRKQKGSKVINNSLQMSQYLLPNQFVDNIEDKRMLFSIINDMYLCTKNNFVKKICFCNVQEETLQHLYECKIYNDKQHDFKYDRIYNGSVKEQKEILEKMQIIFDKRSKMEITNI